MSDERTWLVRLNAEQLAHLDTLIDRSVDDFWTQADYGDYTPEDTREFDQKTAAVREALEAKQDGLCLIFGDGADQSTFTTTFGHLTNGYVIGVNGIDIVCHDAWDGPKVGLYGYAYDGEDPDNLDAETHMGFEWADLETVVIY